MFFLYQKYLWGIVKRKMRDGRLNNSEQLKASIKATWALITPEQCHRLMDSIPRHIAAVIQAKGARKVLILFCSYFSMNRSTSVGQHI